MKSDIENATKLLAKEISADNEAVGLELLIYINTKKNQPGYSNQIVAERCIDIICHKVNSPVDTSKMIEATLLMFPDEVINILKKAELSVLSSGKEDSIDLFVEGVILGLVEACMLWDQESPTGILKSLASFLVTVYKRTTILRLPLSKEVSGKLSNLSSRFMDLFGPCTQEIFFKEIFLSEVRFMDDGFVSQIVAELTLKTFLLQSVTKRVQIMAQYFATQP